VQGEPVGVGRDAITGPIIAEVVLSFPGGIHDEVVRPRNDLQTHQSCREERLEHLIALGGLSGVVDRVGQEPAERPYELFDAMTVTLQDGVLEVER
jgi:hypothetical protein